MRYGSLTLNQILEKQKLTICDVYNWIGDMEEVTRDQIEKENPNTPLPEREGKLEAIREAKWREYRTANSIPDSMRPTSIFMEWKGVNRRVVS